MVCPTTFEIVLTGIDTDDNVLIEENLKRNSLAFLYREDGRGPEVLNRIFFTL